MYGKYEWQLLYNFEKFEGLKIGVVSVIEACACHLIQL